MRVAVLILRIADDVRLGAFGGNAEHSLAFLKDIVASKGEATRIQEVRLRPTARSVPFPLRAVPAQRRSHFGTFPLSAVPTSGRSRSVPFPLRAVPAQRRSHFGPFPLSAVPTSGRSRLAPFPLRAVPA